MGLSGSLTPHGVLDCASPTARPPSAVLRFLVGQTPFLRPLSGFSSAVDQAPGVALRDPPWLAHPKGLCMRRALSDNKTS
jgi:hypothetical protein